MQNFIWSESSFLSLAWACFSKVGAEEVVDLSSLFLSFYTHQAAFDSSRDKSGRRRERKHRKGLTDLLWLVWILSGLEWCSVLTQRPFLGAFLLKVAPGQFYPQFHLAHEEVASTSLYSIGGSVASPQHSLASLFLLDQVLTSCFKFLRWLSDTKSLSSSVPEEHTSSSSKGPFPTWFRMRRTSLSSPLGSGGCTVHWHLTLINNSGSHPETFQWTFDVDDELKFSKLVLATLPFTSPAWEVKHILCLLCRSSAPGDKDCVRS